MRSVGRVLLRGCSSAGQAPLLLRGGRQPRSCGAGAAAAARQQQRAASSVRAAAAAAAVEADTSSSSSSTGPSSAYPFLEIEGKWQQHWEAHQTFRTPEAVDTSKPKFYVLDMFPYPRCAAL